MILWLPLPPIVPIIIPQTLRWLFVGWRLLCHYPTSYVAVVDSFGRDGAAWRSRLYLVLLNLYGCCVVIVTALRVTGRCVDV